MDETENQEHKKPEEEKPPQKLTQQVEELLKEVEKLGTAEEKLRHTIDFMEASLAQKGAPQFKNFWDARKHCIEIFKENIPSALRAVMWEKYCELTKEARRLKELLDEQSAFAIEQIEIAIKALEEDIELFQEQIGKTPAFSLPADSSAIKENAELYANLQRELNLLNAQAGRINALRKELIKTEMRIRHKNKFFQRLSTTGDKVFPRRKELIKQMSDKFIADVESFAKGEFSPDKMQELHFAKREEIKALQQIAKALTLNTHAFNQTRQVLSKCWDKLKEADKERKKEIAEKKSVFEENAKQFLEKIEEVRKNFEEGGLSAQEAQKQFDQISSEMRKTELGRDEVNALRGALKEATQPIRDKLKEAENQHRRQKEELKQKKQEAIESLKGKLQTLIEEGQKSDLKELENQYATLTKEVEGLDLSPVDQREFESLFVPMEDILFEKKDQVLMAEASEHKQYEEILDLRKTQRKKIKERLEQYRKASGGSGLDFEQLMHYNTITNADKERLEKLDQAIREVEKAIQ